MANLQRSQSQATTNLPLRLLFVCVSAALTSLATHAGPSLPPTAIASRTPGGKTPGNPQVQKTWSVQNCKDDGNGSLRDIIQNPANAQSGDIVDLSQLPALCNSKNSTITLSTGEIVINQHDLTIQGPSPDQGIVTISGGHASRVFRQIAGGAHGGTLTLSDLSITAGYSPTTGMPPLGGGCIYTDSSVYLSHVAVADCYSKSDVIGGGAISAPFGEVSLFLSRVSDSKTNGDGGAIYSTHFFAKYSELSGNSSSDSGGAVCTLANGSTMSIYSSTLAGNSSVLGGALYDSSHQSAIKIVNSTLSGNTSKGRGPAISAFSLDIENSTVAFNQDVSSSPTAAVYVLKDGAIDLQSSIVANNTCASVDGVCDLYLKGAATISGADNLVTSSNIASPAQGLFASTSDPKLGPLSWTGGLTRTHELLPGSPALALGNNNANHANDQRGPGFSRATGPTAVVDIGAVQYDTIFSDDMDGGLLF